MIIHIIVSYDQNISLIFSCHASTSVMYLHYRPETVHCSTKDAYTSQITFIALHPWYWLCTVLLCTCACCVPYCTVPMLVLYYTALYLFCLGIVLCCTCSDYELYCNAPVLVVYCIGVKWRAGLEVRSKLPLPWHIYCTVYRFPILGYLNMLYRLV